MIAFAQNMGIFANVMINNVNRHSKIWNTM